MKISLRNRLLAIEERKSADSIKGIDIVHVSCRCGRDYPKLFTVVPIPELNDLEQEKKPSKCARLLHYKEVPIDSVKRCIDPENARNYKNGKEIQRIPGCSKGDVVIND